MSRQTRWWGECWVELPSGTARLVGRYTVLAPDAARAKTAVIDAALSDPATPDYRRVPDARMYVQDLSRSRPRRSGMKPYNYHVYVETGVTVSSDEPLEEKAVRLEARRLLIGRLMEDSADLLVEEEHQTDG